jgi:hypothetical protein
MGVMCGSSQGSLPKEKSKDHLFILVFFVLAVSIISCEKEVLATRINKSKDK